MLKPGDIAIVSGARTPMGRYCGKLKDFTAQALGAVAAKGAIERAGIDPKEFDHVVFGNAQQTSGDALYGARHVGLRAGLPIETPALTVNRLCGSGMQAIVNAAQMVQTDEAKIVLAGGMEAMSQAPFVIRGRDGFTLAAGGNADPTAASAPAIVWKNLQPASKDVARTAVCGYAVRLQSVQTGSGACHFPAAEDRALGIRSGDPLPRPQDEIQSQRGSGGVGTQRWGAH